MYQEHSLEEPVNHGTKQIPLAVLHLKTGNGTESFKEYFVSMHWHHKIEILYINKGRFTIEINLKKIEIDEGDICVINSGELHQLKGHDIDSEHTVIQFDPQILGFSYHDEIQEKVILPLLNQNQLFPNIIKVSSIEYIKAQRKVLEIVKLFDEKQDNWYFKTKICLMILLDIMMDNNKLLQSNNVLGNRSRHKIERYKKVVTYMELHYMEHITLQQLSAIGNCTPQHLHTFFHEIVGISPIKYLLIYRIEQAKYMLKNTEQSVLEISLECGFENVSYFIRQFKKITGKTPVKYKKFEID